MLLSVLTCVIENRIRYKLVEHVLAVVISRIEISRLLIQSVICQCQEFTDDLAFLRKFPTQFDEMKSQTNKLQREPRGSTSEHFAVKDVV